MKNKKIFILILLLATSCNSNVHKKWSSCRNTESKLGCASISKADEAYNIQITDDSLASTLKYDVDKYLSFDSNKAGEKKQIVRTSDKVGRIWIAPYMDGNGNFHEESYVKVVDELSKWEMRNSSAGGDNEVEED